MADVVGTAGRDGLAGVKCDVAFSYEGEAHSKLAHEVEAELKKVVPGVSCFHDHDQIEDHIAANDAMLARILELAFKGARLCVVFYSDKYPDKKWPKFEWSHIAVRGTSTNTILELLVFRWKGVSLPPGLLGDFRSEAGSDDMNPRECAETIAARLNTLHKREPVNRTKVVQRHLPHCRDVEPGFFSASVEPEGTVRP